MKFRIVSNGSLYKVQGKSFLQWNDMDESLRYYSKDMFYNRPASYNTFQEAEQDIKKKHGELAEIVKSWQVVNK